jgi:trehalose 6-phosphate synthase
MEPNERPEGAAARARGSAMEAPVVVASNRGPIAYERDERGRLVPRKGSGGLVTALSGVFFHDDATWVAAAFTDADEEIARGGRAVGAGPSQHVRFVRVPADRFDLAYNEFSNRILWFAFHYLWDVSRQPIFGEHTGRAWEAFVETNQAFARELAKEADRDPVFLIQDYQLALVPRMLRELAPESRIVHFMHTPFAGPQYLRILPAWIRHELMRGLAGADLIGFQSRAWAENFLLGVRATPGLRVDLRSGRVAVGDHRGTVRVFPVAVNPHALREAAETPRAGEAREEVAALRADGKLLLRVDRLEPSKNVLRGFLAYEAFLRRHPSWRERATFLALLSPSRDKLHEYQAYADECLGEVARINEDLGTATWKPIQAHVQEDFLYAVGAYAEYDALLVNPAFDGMNLVSMEGPLMNTRQGALVLSTNAGAFERIGRHALAVNPFDIDETADAIALAFEMDADERERRARGLSRSVLAHTPESWLWSQLEGLDSALRRAGRHRSEGGEERSQSGGAFDDHIGSGP